MTTSNPSPEEIRRLHEAGEWVQKMRCSELPDEIEAWMEWCGRDARNLAAFEGMQEVWMGFGSSPRARQLRRRYLSVGLAASVLGLVGASGWLMVQYPRTQIFGTSSGVEIHETLADGSHLDLAPGSHLRAGMSWFRRELWLDRGEAYFVVARGTLRPFVVHANDVTATAAGTAFDVRTEPQDTVVTVIEGRVAVAPGAGLMGAAPGSEVGSFSAGVGQRVTVSRVAPALSVVTVDPERAASWRDGVLQFIGEPLPQVVGELNRFIPQTIVVSSALQGARFTGTVSTRRVQDWLDALKQIFSVEVVKEKSNGIEILPRKS
jgi:transmembrane sensor